MYKKRLVIPGSDEEDGDTPESIPLVDSKQAVRLQDSHLQKFHAREMQKRKERNREQDRKRKERAQTVKEVRGAEDVETGIERVVREAQENIVGDDDVSGSDVDDGASNEDDGDEKNSESSDSDKEMGSDEDTSLGTRFKARRNVTDRLPDELFVSAFTAQSSRSQNTLSPSKKDKSVSQPNVSDAKRHRKLGPRKTKDRILGSRVIRALKDPSLTGLDLTNTSTIPPRKIRKFVERTHGFTARSQKTKGWARKPAHLGVFKANGPPAKFVRRT